MRPGGDERGKSDRRLPGGRSDGGQCYLPDGAGIESGLGQRLHDLGCALVKQCDKQMPGPRGLADGAGEQESCLLRLRVEIACAAPRRDARRCHHIPK